MSTDLNDPKLTAYVLGELSDSERDRLEQDAAADPALRAEIDALRGIATRLETELAAEPTPACPVSTIRPAPNGKPPLRRFAIAASLLAAAGVASYAAPRWQRVEVDVSLGGWMDDAGYRPAKTTAKSERDRADAGGEADAEQATRQSAVARSPGLTVGDPLASPSKRAIESYDEQVHGLYERAGNKADSRTQQHFADQPYSPASAKPLSGDAPVEAAPAKADGRPIQVQGQGTRRGGGRTNREGDEASQRALISTVDQAQSSYDNLRDQSSGGVRVATITDQSRRYPRAPIIDELTAIPVDERGPPFAPTASPGAESYAPIAEQPFTTIRDKASALSTFSIDVDTASYSIVRSKLLEGRLPDVNAVRVEEFINYFQYDYPQPEGDAPFSVNLEVAGCPWQPEHRLVRVGLKGREIPRDKRPASNLVFLLDVSGSMQPENKLPLVKQSMKLLVEQLGENDRVAIVTYAGEAGLKLSSTTAAEKEKINAAIDSLYAGGSTNGEGGLKLAYDVAVGGKIAGGTNRIILVTDGDFNVGLSSDDEMESLITKEAGSGVFLTAIGVGMGNLKDSKLERLADKGNGNYAYIDKPSEAHKVFVEQLAGTLCTIAKDVKIQVEFNPATVRAHRLVGYENRLLAHKDFNDDRKDAGEIGAGHTVTALYEVVPATAAPQVAAAAVDKSRYQSEPPVPAVPLSDAAKSGELMVVKLRYKQPEGSESKLIETTLPSSDKRFYEASADFKFAAAVATFAMRLRDSQHRGGATFALALELAQSALAKDESGRRREFVDLVTKAKQLTGER